MRGVMGTENTQWWLDQKLVSRSPTYFRTPLWPILARLSLSPSLRLIRRSDREAVAGVRFQLIQGGRPEAAAPPPLRYTHGHRKLYIISSGVAQNSPSSSFPSAGGVIHSWKATCILIRNHFSYWRKSESKDRPFLLVFRPHFTISCVFGRVDVYKRQT